MAICLDAQMSSSGEFWVDRRDGNGNGRTRTDQFTRGVKREREFIHNYIIIYSGPIYAYEGI